MKTKDFPLEIKGLTDEGTFEGYGSIFGNIDQQGEVVEPGAFTKSLARHGKAGTQPVMLWQHDTHVPIGVWENLTEDAKGLHGTGRLILEVSQAREAHALMKAGVIRGLSIGYREVDVKPDGPVRRLKALDLFEISVVTFAANNRAQVGAVKADLLADRMQVFAQRLRDGEPMPVKEFEAILRDAGVPRSMATRVAAEGYAKAIRSDSDGAMSETTRAILHDALAAFKPA